MARRISCQGCLLGLICTRRHLKSHTYSLVVQFMPLHFKPDNSNKLRMLEELNGLPMNAFLQVHWIKPPYHRVAEKTCGHVLAVMTHPKDANKILTNSLIICQKQVYTKKCKKEPTHCLKCHGWGHLSYDCQLLYSICGMCAGRHQTSGCNNQDKPHCTSCCVDGHPSWDCRCPIFLSKCHDMDLRPTENQMPYFPTATPWTHALCLPKPAPPAPTPELPLMQQSQPGATGMNHQAPGSQPQLY